MDRLAGAGVGAGMELSQPDENGRSIARLDQAQRERLATFLRPLAWMDGLITAAVIAPNAAGTLEDAVDWLDYIWSEKGEAEIGKLTLAQTSEIVAPVMDHYCYVANSLSDDPETYRPYLAGATSNPLEAAADWAAGLRIGIGVYDGGWGPLCADKNVLTLLLVVFSLLRDEDMPEDMRAESPFRDIPADRREHIRRTAVERLPEIVLDLYDRARSLDEDEDFELDEEAVEPSEPFVRATPKVGRNDPCPCGSGKKYKKCCLDRE